jgi:hypothetical protein
MRQFPSGVVRDGTSLPRKVMEQMASDRTFPPVGPICSGAVDVAEAAEALRLGKLRACVRELDSIRVHVLQNMYMLNTESCEVKAANAMEAVDS